jgi:hypothetical protein
MGRPVIEGEPSAQIELHSWPVRSRSETGATLPLFVANRSHGSAVA